MFQLTKPQLAQIQERLNDNQVVETPDAGTFQRAEGDAANLLEHIMKGADEVPADLMPIWERIESRYGKQTQWQDVLTDIEILLKLTGKG